MNDHAIQNQDFHVEYTGGIESTVFICLLNKLENSFVQLCHLVRCNIKEYYTIIHVHQCDTNNQTLVDQIISIQLHTRMSCVAIPELIRGNTSVYT